MVTSHGSCFVLGLLEVLLGQFQIKVEAYLLLLQFRKLGSKITRLLQSANKICQSMKTKVNHSENCSKTTPESNIQQ